MKVKKPKIQMDLDWILDIFQIEIQENTRHLQIWLAAHFELPITTLQQLENLSDLYKKEGDSWNEEELKIHFIAILLYIAQPEEKGIIKVFLERNIKVETEHYLISVDVDLIFAKSKGLNTPQKPYFFLQELKKGKNSANDPEAQMLIAMIASQYLNEVSRIVYGGYVVGRFWFFATLENKVYSLSRAFDITNIEDLKQVIFNLKKIKELVKD